jgi:hypothetical protein
MLPIHTTTRCEDIEKANHPPTSVHDIVECEESQRISARIVVTTTEQPQPVRIQETRRTIIHFWSILDLAQRARMPFTRSRFLVYNSAVTNLKKRRDETSTRESFWTQRQQQHPFIIVVFYQSSLASHPPSRWNQGLLFSIAFDRGINTTVFVFL